MSCWRLWAKCGDVLHRGSLKNLIKAKTPVQNQFADVVEWGQKIANLLNNHRIVTLGKEYAFVTLLHDGNSEVKVALGQTMPRAAPLDREGFLLTFADHQFSTLMSAIFALAGMVECFSLYAGLPALKTGVDDALSQLGKLPAVAEAMGARDDAVPDQQ